MTTSELLRKWIEAGIAEADDELDSARTLLPVELLQAVIDAPAAPTSKSRGALAELVRNSGQTSAQVRTKISAKCIRVVTYTPRRTTGHRVKDTTTK